MDAGPDAGTSPEAPPPPVPLGTARPLPACSSAVYADGAYLIGRHPAMWLDSTGRIMGGPLDRDVGGVFDGRDLILGSPSGGFLRVRTDLTTRDGWSPLHPRTPGGSGDPDDWTEESLEHIECGGRRCALITRYTDRSYLRFDYDLRRRVFDMSDPPREIASESVLRSSWNEGTGTWMNRTLYFAGDVAGGALVSYEEGLLAPAFTEWDVDLAGSATVNRGDVLEDMPVI